jgi:MurNAc alpha-1-phosphate uridylyltransferase
MNSVAQFSGRAQAIVLAAGRGERMRPLTDATPKPLLTVRGQPLLHWHLDALASAGWRRVLINTAWLGAQIPARLGTHWPQPGAAAGASRLELIYSMEARDFGGALETAGGIARALPELDERFWVVAGDVFVPGFEFAAEAMRRFAASDKLAHLWLVPNPAHHPNGDFGLSPEGLALNLPADAPGVRHTYSTIGLYRRELFGSPWLDLPAGNPQGQAAALGPLLRRAIDQGRVSAELWPGPWTDVGTPERLAALNQHPESL